MPPRANPAALAEMARNREAHEGKIRVSFATPASPTHLRTTLALPQWEDLLSEASKKLRFRPRRLFLSSGQEVTEENASAVVRPGVTLIATKGEEWRGAAGAAAEQIPEGPAQTGAEGKQVPHLQIDGSILEGGGQVLRNSIAYAALLDFSLTIEKIRYGRARPGLAAQHLTGLQLVTDLAGGRLYGAELNSTRVRFDPFSAVVSEGGQLVQREEYTADIKTAGSICLLIQSALPVLAFAQRRIATVLKGGTNAEMAPQIEYVQEVLQPTLKRHFGIDFTLTVEKRGWFPKGGGIVKLVTNPVRSIPPCVILERGDLVRIRGAATVSGRVGADVADAMVKAAVNYCRSRLGGTVPITIEPKVERGADGIAIYLCAETSQGHVLCGSALGNPKNPNGADVGRRAAEMLCDDWNAGGCVDQWLQDQLIIWMALASGTSMIRTGPLTLHTQTAIHFAQQLTGAKFTVLSHDAFLASPYAAALAPFVAPAAPVAPTASAAPSGSTASSSGDSALPLHGLPKRPERARHRRDEGKTAGTTNASSLSHTFVIVCEGIGYRNRWFPAS